MSDSVLEAPARPAFANYVGGNWQPANSGRTYDKHNPARPSELVGEFPATDCRSQMMQRLATSFWIA